MKTYILTHKSDASNEPINKKDFESLEEAILYWSYIKKLNLEIFNRIYEVSRFYKE
jgi:hypothetical protein